MSWASLIRTPRRLWVSWGHGTRTALLLCLFGFSAQLLVWRADIHVLNVLADGSVRLTDPLTTLFAIHGQGLAHGFVWSPITYLFLHGSWTHLLLNAIGLLVMGSAVEGLLGTRRFWNVFLLSGVVGGIGWSLAQGLGSEAYCVGASAGVLGLIGCYAALRPRDRFLLIFPFPVTLTARTLAIWLAAANAIDLAFGHGRQIAYLAHLFGMVAGALYGLSLQGLGRSGFRRWFRNVRHKAQPDACTLDDVLAKIQRGGMRYLTENDRRILEEAAQRGLEGYPHKR